MGLFGGANTPVAWSFYHPGGITDVNFANGEKYNVLVATDNEGSIGVSLNGQTWISKYSVPHNTATNTWASWSRSASLAGTFFYVRLALNSSKTTAALEVADVTLTLTNTPTVSMGPETAQYNITGTLENTTTGESITLRYPMSLNTTLEVDTLNKTVTYLEDNDNAIAALTLSSTRTEWLKLAQGTNVLKYTETGMTGVDIVVKWRARNN